MIDSGKEYRWEGKFESIENDELLYIPDKDKFIYGSNILLEKLANIKKNKVLIKREANRILFREKELPKLSSTESMLSILKEEIDIEEVFRELNKIDLKDYAHKNDDARFLTEYINRLKKVYKTFEDIKNSNEEIKVKLFLCSELNLKIFNLIEQRFKDIFPQVEAIKIEEDDKLGLFDTTKPTISIKEKGVDKWIEEYRMSSGMLRTIMHIAELYLSNDGSIILIDEFENSLGVNCIDILTDDLIHENKSLQFIATSHHPYIINNIPYEYWKIVSRKGGNIQVRNAAAYKLGKSKQAAFIQLTKMIEKQAAAI